MGLPLQTLEQVSLTEHQGHQHRHPRSPQAGTDSRWPGSWTTRSCQGSGQAPGTAVYLGRELRRAHVQETRDRSLHGARYPLIKVDSNMKLGEWAGLRKIDQEGKARKVVKCSACVVRDWGKESPAHDVLQEYLKANK